MSIAKHTALFVVVVCFGLDNKDGDTLVVYVVDDTVVGSDATR